MHLISKLPKFYRTLFVILVLSPITLGLLLCLPLFNFSNGSNDGWLGFWGGYLGSVIAVLGVFWQVNRQLNFEQTLEDKRNRPYLNFLIQWGIKRNDRVYHSTNSVTVEDYRGYFYRLTNILDAPALNVLFCIYIKKERNPINIVSVQSLRNETVSINPSLPKNARVAKIEVCYKTTRGEYGLLHSRTHDEEFLYFPKYFYGKIAKYRFDEAIKQFNRHNRRYQSSLTKVWHQYTSVFNEEDLKQYSELNKKLFQQKFSESPEKIKRRVDNQIT